MPKVVTQVYILIAKFGSFLEHVEMGEIRQNVISSSSQHPIFATHISFIKTLPLVWSC